VWLRGKSRHNFSMRRSDPTRSGFPPQPEILQMGGGAVEREDVGLTTGLWLDTPPFVGIQRNAFPPKLRTQPKK